MGSGMRREKKSNKKVKTMMKKFTAICLGHIVLCTFLLSGCGTEGQQEEENLVILEQGGTTIDYSLAETVISDVVKTKKVRCDYRQLESVDIAFAESGKTIKKVHVQAGDEVVKGQLLAELDVGEVDGKIRKLEYQIARNTLLLSHLEENENNEISTKWLGYLYGSDKSDKKREAVEEAVADLQQGNAYSREDYEDAIAMDMLELEQIQRNVANSYVYADRDGTISYVKPGLEGSFSEADERIISIIDGTEGIFVAEDTEYASYFSEGVAVTASVLSGMGAGEHELMPYKMEEWGDVLMFTFADEIDSSVIKVGTIGSLKVITGIREQVLNIPKSAVHTADGKSYVYVVGEGNVREMKWIETGLYGDNSVEVVSGLTEGEKVILK